MAGALQRARMGLTTPEKQNRSMAPILLRYTKIKLFQSTHLGCDNSSIREEVKNGKCKIDFKP